ncbi:hypothetical protein [Nannocystis punicea]|uniref:Uncharacterized protein n=1 Tax=Nannocystis punicea TaxID=2995304 RepID=A0ABY7HF47_9BACT|nr:hypothetical protein [Nannocystis poenicansa]WAS97758.1 hypothetical protein O0S08_16570 [Nannocystis poenicansa]
MSGRDERMFGAACPRGPNFLAGAVDLAASVDAREALRRPTALQSAEAGP